MAAENLVCGSYYEKLLLNFAPDGGKKKKTEKKMTEKIGDARQKTDVFKSNNLLIPPCLCFVGFAN